MSGIPIPSQKRPHSSLEEQAGSRPQPKVLLLQLSTIIEGRNSIADCFRTALAAVLNKKDIPLFTEEELYRECYRSPLVVDMMRNLGIRELSEEEQNQLADQYVQNWRDRGLPLLTLCRGARELLEAAKAQDSIKVAILTNNVPVAKAVLEMLHVSHLVDTVGQRRTHRHTSVSCLMLLVTTQVLDTLSYEAHRTTDGEVGQPGLHFWVHWYHVVVPWFDRLTRRNNPANNAEMDVSGSPEGEQTTNAPNTSATTVTTHADLVDSEQTRTFLHPSEALLVSRTIYDLKIVAQSGMQTCWLHDISEAAHPETNAANVNDNADASSASGDKTPLTVEQLIAETDWYEQEKKENMLRKARQYREEDEKTKSEVDFAFSELDDLKAFVFGAGDRSATASLGDDNQGEVGVAPLGVTKDQEVVIKAEEAVIKAEEDDGSVFGLNPTKDDQVVVIDDNDSDNGGDEVLFVGEGKVVA